MINQEIGFIFAIVILLIGIVFLFGLEYALVPNRKKIFDKLNKKRYLELLLLIVSFVIFWLCNNHYFNANNNFSYLAKALLEGHLDVPDMPGYLESVSYKGKQYMHFAPGPSLLSIPFVAIWGVQGFNCALLAMFLGACNMPLAFGVLNNLEIGDRKDRLWLSAMLNFGTVHFFCASQGSSWFLGHVSVLFFLLLAILFLTSKKNAFSYKNLFLSGLFFGLAVTCRLSALLGGVFFVGYLIIKCPQWWKKVAVFGCGAAVFGGLYMLYNFVRYDTIMDMGYNLTYLKDYHREYYDALQAAPVDEQKELFKEYRKTCGGPLQFRFIRSNLYSVFLLAPAFQKEFPYIIPTMAGVAVTYTSPMLYCALFAERKTLLNWVLGITTILTAMPFLMNYGNGMAQFGMRYSMDFTPYLWMLMCYALTKKGGLKLWMKIGISICILIQGWGTLFWTFLYS